MPSEFKCSACDLRLSVGWYHYHRIQDGYSGRTLLACRACGGQHAVEHAMRDRGPKSYPLLKVTVQSASTEAKNIIARRWLRKERSMSYNEALEAVRNLPLVLHERTHLHVVAAVQKELEPLGVQLTVEVVGELPNTSYGPIRADRLLFSPERQCGERRQEWTIGPNITQDLEQICCSLCGGAGSLTAEIGPAAPCPSCDQGQLALVSQWIT
jgi:hypothetical protein